MGKTKASATKQPASSTNGHASAYDLVPVARIAPSATNPRRRFDECTLDELAESIRQKGVLQPILVRPFPNGPAEHYELVAGERRWRAACKAGLTHIPATVRSLSDQEVLEIQVIENEQRQDVTPLEKADGYGRLLEAHGVTVEDLATRVGKSVSTIRGLLKLRQLPELARRALELELIPASVAQLIGRVPGEKARHELTCEVLGAYDPDEPINDILDACANWATAEILSYREAKDIVERRYMRELKQAPFSQADKKLLPGAGSCKECPKRTGNNPDFADSRADVCTDPACFDLKASTHKARLTAKARAEGFQMASDSTARQAFNSNGEVSGWVGLVDYDAIWNPEAPKKAQQSYRDALQGLGKGLVECAVDPKGKLRYLISQRDAERELIAAGLKPKPYDPARPALINKTGGPSPCEGLPEQARTCEQAVDQACGVNESPEPVQTSAPPPKPEPRVVGQYAVDQRAARIAAGVLYEMGANNPQGLEGLQELGDSSTCAAWEALKLLCLDLYEEAMDEGMGDAPVLIEGCVSLLDHLAREGDEHDLVASFRSWLDRAEPAQLIGFLLKARALTVLQRYAELSQHARQAYLDWAEMDWDALQEQARRELEGKPAKEASE